MKPALSAVVLAALLNLSPFCAVAQTTPQQSSVPDAPKPQTAPRLTGAGGSTITPGLGAGIESSTGSSSSAVPDAITEAPSTMPSPAQGRETQQSAPPTIAQPGDETNFTLRVHTNYVDLPVTVKDKNGKLVPGLDWREFKVYENKTFEPLAFFSVNSTALSVSFVIDQSLPSPVMDKVNQSLGAVQGALTPSDEIAIFTYSNGTQERTGFTGAQSARVPFVFGMAKVTGTDPQAPVNSGAFATCNIRENGNCVDPNIQAGRSAGNGQWINIPKETHTLNDAILSAAKELSRRPKERRRVIYVVSDGKEYGSKATYKEVVRYLQMHNIAVYGTAVGDSARWGEGYLSRFHIPFTMYDNLLIKYTLATGGTLDSGLSVNGIEKSYARIAEEARTQYTLGYYTKEPVIDGKFRKVDVRVGRPGLEVIAKDGYYPTPQQDQ